MNLHLFQFAKNECDRENNSYLRSRDPTNSTSSHFKRALCGMDQVLVKHIEASLNNELVGFTEENRSYELRT